MRSSWQRRGDALYPADRLAEDRFHKIPDNHFVMGEFRRSRSLTQHRYAFAILTNVWQATAAYDKYPTVEHFLDDVKWCLGYRRKVFRGGHWIETTDSIAFDKMDQDEFNNFVQRMLALFHDQLGIDPEQLKAEAA